jgi:hypothetical protein
MAEERTPSGGQGGGTAATGGGAASLLSIFTPEVGAIAEFGLNIASAAAGKSATSIAAWGKWESDTVQAIRKAAEIDKQNFRAYQVDLENWFKQSKYTEELRQYESALQKQAAELKTATSQSALQEMGRRLADLDARFYEQEAAATIQLENIRLKSVADSVKRVASGQVGRTIERIGNSYHQQWLANASNRQITRQYRIADKLSAGKAASIDAQNKTNSVALYNPRPYADPVQPLAPIPTDTYLPKQPSVSGSLSILDVAGIALKSVKSYEEMRPPQGDTDKPADKPADKPPATPAPAPAPAPAPEEKK